MEQNDILLSPRHSFHSGWQHTHSINKLNMNKEIFNKLKCPKCNLTFLAGIEFAKHPCMTPKGQRETVIRNLISLAALAVSIVSLITVLTD